MAGSITWVRRLLVAIPLLAAVVLLAVLHAPRALAADPTTVEVGAYINDIHSIDLEHHAYTIDFYLWMKWDDPNIDPTESVEIVNHMNALGLLRNKVYPVPKQMSDGTWYQAIHFQGTFTNKLPLHQYPFDHQDLTVVLRDVSATSEDLIFVPDDDGITLSDDLELPGWNVGAPTMTISEKPFASSIGDSDAPDGQTYSQVVLAVPVTRPVLTSSLKLFFPLSIVLLTAALTFFLKPNRADARIGTAITALLTLVALQFTVNDDLPTVEYLMMIDVIYAISLLYVLFTLAMAIYAAWRADDVDVDTAVALDRKLLAISLLAYLLLLLLTMWWFLWRG